MEEDITQITIKDLEKTAQVFEKNKTPRSERKINIIEGDTKYRLRLSEAHNYVEHNRKRD